jgi:hypothetical protein
MFCKKITLPAALSLGMMSCIPAPLRDYVYMYDALRAPSRAAAAAVLQHDGEITIDYTSRRYTVRSLVAAQLGQNHFCTYTLDDLVDHTELSRHIAEMKHAIRTNTTCNISSACWCLGQMERVRHALFTGNVTYGPTQFQYCPSTQVTRQTNPAEIFIQSR